MKKILCSMLVWVMVLGCIGVYADTGVLFGAMDKSILSADVHTEFGIKLNKPFEFINQLMSEEDMNNMPVDFKMLAEGVCDINETADVSYSMSEDYKQLKMSAKTQTTLPLKFNENFKADIWSQVGAWIDADFKDEQNPKFVLTYKIPFSAKYMVFDYSDMIEYDEIAAEQFLEYMNKYLDKELSDELNKKIKDIILENVEVKETLKNKNYILTADDNGFKNIIKQTANELYDMVYDAFEVYDMTGGKSYRYEMEQYLSVLDEFNILGKDGMQIKISMKGKEINISEILLHIDCNLYDALDAYGINMSKFERDKWQIDCVASAKFVYENINEQNNIEFPEITEENAERVLREEMYEYVPMYNRVTVYSSYPTEPDADGNFMVALSEAMQGFEIAKKYYSVENDKIIITPRQGQYDFAKAEMSVNSNILTIDSNQITLKSNVLKDENGVVFIPADALTSMTGFDINGINHSFDEEYVYVDSIIFQRKNPEYEEKEETPYISPSIYLYEDGTPMMYNNELYAPLRITMKEFGIGDGDIEAVNGEIIITDSKEEVPEFSVLKLTEGSRDVYIDSVLVALNNPIIERDGAAYISSQMLEILNCSIENISYNFKNQNYNMRIHRNLLDNKNNSNYKPYQSENLYLYVSEKSVPVIEDGEYYLPLYPLMGELKVRAEDIKTEGDKITVFADLSVSGFEKMEFQGNSVKVDNNQYTMSKEMIERNGKMYLPAEFITSVQGGVVRNLYISYGKEETVYNYSASIPNPLYEEME